MADLGSRTNLDTAINTLLDDAQPNEAIQPSDHNTLLKNALDTVANGLPNTLRTNPETGGQDLEVTSGDNIDFKNSGFVGALTSGTLTGNQTYTLPDNTGTIALTSDIVSGGGVVGISDSSGSYTYYSTYALAVASAGAGDIIEQFGNITETGNVTITIPIGVSVNMNGYTYTLDGSDNSAFVYNGVGTKTKIINGTIIKQNSPTPNGGGVGLEIGQTAELDLSGLTVISDGLYCLNFNTSGSGQGLIVGGIFYYTGTGTGFGHIVEGKMKNAFFNTGTSILRVIGESLQDSMVLGAVQLATNGVLKNVNIYNTLATHALNLADGKAYNCEVYSQSSYGIYSISNNSEVYNSTARSDSNHGIHLGRGKAFNCYGFSNANVGLFVNQLNAEAYNCTGESSATAGAELRIGKLVNCIGISTFNNTAGHGFLINNNGGKLINCFAQVTNAGAYALQGTVARNLTFANLTGTGMTTLIGTNITNNQTNTPDAYGNILI